MSAPALASLLRRNLAWARTFTDLHGTVRIQVGPALGGVVAPEGGATRALAARSLLWIAVRWLPTWIEIADGHLGGAVPAHATAPGSPPPPPSIDDLRGQ
ncbi:hypothetical protein [Nonomuraea sp. SYSU D8015]|uniref:hypothetical protein n=1 Tax=Nonomuraea sp. SYSU D8015 TaxID=2593644 RepID=UPI00166098D5|nr:hypothetical protein [Nonomuraea sp. SYSU D8015]